MGHALKCFLFMFSLVLLACRREGSTHDDTQEDVITTAVRPLHSLYGVWSKPLKKMCDTVGNKGRGAWKISQGLEGRTGTV
ncbi:hypothetical protein DER46DRAFT_198221 [Fusarium sp. MPI-SDFR-AT-0072]|nr:hypothetical protein DER46DRAFT_198221 [Fusarium sp. MPI-SDFR-AT-0072]